MDYIVIAINYLIKVIIWSFNQIFILLAPLILLSFLMHYLSKGIRIISYRLFGRNIFLKYLGIIGIPIHELGHALFAIIFGHRITEIKLFEPDATDGTLGYVSHRYNKNNLYHLLGNFFIGIGPIILGASILALFAILLFNLNLKDSGFQEFNFSMFLNSISFKVQLEHLWEVIIAYSQEIFNNPNSWWKMIIYIYLLISIGSNISLSPPDIKHAFKGSLIFVIALLIFNLATLWIGNFVIDIFAKSSLYTALINFFLILSLLINSLILVLLSIALSIKSIIKR